MLSPANPLHLSAATLTVLRNAAMPTDAPGLMAHTAGQLLAIHGIGDARLSEIRHALDRSGLRLFGDMPDLASVLRRLATCLVVTEVAGRPVVAIATDRTEAADTARQLAALIGAIAEVDIVTENTFAQTPEKSEKCWRNGGRSGIGEKPHAR